MKYTYTNTTGTTEIEVDEQFYDLLISMDREEFNSDRKHSRRYPISLENCEYEGEWFEDSADPIAEAETALEQEQMLASLTELQRICFVEVCLNGRSQKAVGTDLSISQQMVDKHVRAARKKLKKVFEG
jgi:DNA-directed RNA polymerase specialized sigma24 family protein